MAKQTIVKIDKESNKGISFTVTEVNDYTLEPEFQAVVEYKDKFSDNTEVDTYLLTKDNKLYVNGELKSQPTERQLATLGDDGGYPETCHYYSSDYSEYYFACYNDVAFDDTYTSDWIEPAGSHISSYVYTSNLLFNSAKSSVDSFEEDREDYTLAVNAFCVALGTFIISWGTIVGAVGSGGAAAVAAATAIDKFADCEDDVADAYGYISNF